MSVTKQPAKYQDRYESLGWWQKLCYWQNPHLWIMAWKSEEMEDLTQALRMAVEWNAEYKKINNLVGDPYWVEVAEKALRSASK